MRVFIVLILLSVVGCGTESLDEKIDACRKRGFNDIRISVSDGLYFGTKYYINCSKE